MIIEPPLIGQRAAEQQTINPTCHVFGSPKPLITWLKGTEQLTGGRYKVLEDGHLEITVWNRSIFYAFDPDYKFEKVFTLYSNVHLCCRMCLWLILEVILAQPSTYTETYQPLGR